MNMEQDGLVQDEQTHVRLFAITPPITAHLTISSSISCPTGGCNLTTSVKTSTHSYPGAMGSGRIRSYAREDQQESTCSRSEAKGKMERRKGGKVII